MNIAEVSLTQVTVIAVVSANEIYLATVDVTLLVDHCKISSLGFADSAIARSRTAVRHCVANLDLSIADPGFILALCQRQPISEHEANRAQGTFLSALFIFIGPSL